MQQESETNIKIRNNAISAYFMIVVSWSFLFIQKQPLINNKFVKSHTQTAMLLHIAFFMVGLIFLWFQLFWGMVILGIWLNNIIASTLFLWIFWVLLYGVHQANAGKYFTLVDIVQLTKTENILQLNQHNALEEKDKLTVILSYIPFLGYIIYGKHREKDILTNIIHINTLATLIIILMIVWSHSNLSLLLLLGYIIFVVFSSLILLTKDELIAVNFWHDISMTHLENYTEAIVRYLKWYFTNTFRTFSQTFEDIEKEKITEQKSEKESLSEAKKYPLPSIFIYIPVLNSINIFLINTQMIHHVINWLSITILMSISWAIWWISNSVQILLLIPLFYGFGMIDDAQFKLPFIYKIWNFMVMFFRAFGKMKKTVSGLSKKKEKVTLKPEQKK